MEPFLKYWNNDNRILECKKIEGEKIGLIFHTTTCKKYHLWGLFEESRAVLTIFDIGYSDGTLGNIRRQDDFPDTWRESSEHKILLFLGYTGVKHDYLPLDFRLIQAGTQKKRDIR